ncbi:hypothetical protein LCIT_03270 [Leuconostoc citreum]|uniref:Uncharacterized protein n=1 Tax=Leuconostoc citreum TaxID=33964 RepID=A0A5A5TZM1_LEUCI|nr:hypothetical protein [Leuconostoc citreum]GDZ83085.1 hypothetical protein LCIT_03270 [Leuconostoc citreum]
MYLPTMKNKQGELRALHEFLKCTVTHEKVDNLLPNIVISDTSSAELDKIKKQYTQTTLLDTRELSGDEIIDLISLVNDPNYNQFKIVFPLEFIIAEENAELLQSLEIEYTSVQASELASPLIQKALSSYVEDLPKNIILDFGYIDSGVVPFNINRIVSILSDKNIFILSGSIPATIPAASNQDYSQDIFEFILYKNIISLPESKNVNINFGDYTVNHPNPTPINGPIIPIVQIKYTRQNKKEFWLVRNGKRQGNYDFHPVANTITGDSNFSVKSWGDEYLLGYLNGTESVGNAATWSAISINRHISIFS